MSWYEGLGVSFVRARDWYLYDRRGNRYVDYCQAGGRAILGHRVRGLSTAVKNEISRGVWTAVDDPWVHRVTGAVRRLLASAGFHDLRSVILVEDVRTIPAALDTAGGDDGRPRVLLWRPFCRCDQWDGADVLVPVVPWPFPDQPVPACALTEAGASFLASLGQVRSVVPFVGAGMVRACAALATAPARESLEARAVPVPPGYVANGQYLVAAGAEPRLCSLGSLDPVPYAEGAWRDVRTRALASGMVFPVRPEGPFVVPPQLSVKETDALRRFRRDA